MDKSLAKFAVLFSEVDCANNTGCPVVPDAFVASLSISFVPIHKYLRSLALRIRGAGNVLIGENRSFFYLIGTKGPINSRWAFNRMVRYWVPDTSE